MGATLAITAGTVLALLSVSMPMLTPVCRRPLWHRMRTTLNTLAGNAGQPIHAMYATTQFWNQDGLPATDWTLNWAHGLIESAPRPKHG